MAIPHVDIARRDKGHGGGGGDHDEWNDDPATPTFLASTTDALLPSSSPIATGTDAADSANETSATVPAVGADDDGAEEAGGRHGGGSKAAQLAYADDVAIVWCSIIGLFTLLALFLLFKRKRGSSTAKPKTSLLQKMVAAVRSVSYRRFPLIGGMSAGVMGMIALFWVVGMVMALVETPWYEGAGDPPLGIRTGMMALALLPLVWGLSGKVNFITFLTGYGYERLNVFHRHVSYIAFVLAVIHTVAFFLAPYNNGGAEAVAQRFYSPDSEWYNGVPTLSIFFFLSFFSLRIFRRNWYETFVAPHILAAVVFLALLFWHVPDRYWAWLYAVCAIWSAQIVLRVVLKTRAAHAIITSVDGDITRVVVSPRLGSKARLRWRPGEHVFLRFPKMRMWETHPFTIASVAGGIPVSGGGGVVRRPASEGSEGVMSGTGNGEMLFLIRPYKGMTRRLHKLTDSPHDVAKKTVLVDGPYGGYTEDMAAKYESVILVAGGSGIAGILAAFEVLSAAAGRGDDKAIQRVDLVWIVSHREQLDWAQDKLRMIRETAAPGAVGVETYVSGQRSYDGDVPSDVESERGILGEDERVVAREKGRGMGRITREILRGNGNSVAARGHGSPAMESLIPQLLLRDARTCVVVCGPDSLIRDSANAVARAQKKVLKGELQEISLRTQVFGW